MQDSKEEVLEQLGETYGYVTRLVKSEVEYYKLTVAESTAKGVSGAITAIVLLVLGLIALTFALITLGFALSQIFFPDPARFIYGFGILTLLLLLILVLIVALRKQLITNPAVKKVISAFFKHDGKEV